MEEKNIANTIIKPSKIHGLGIFATKTIKKGELIIQVDKIDLTKNVSEWLVYNKSKHFSMCYERGYCLVNHSENPNTVRNENFDIISSRNIQIGEEITENYNELPDSENPFINCLEEVIFKAKKALNYYL